MKDGGLTNPKVCAFGSVGLGHSIRKKEKRKKVGSVIGTEPRSSRLKEKEGLIRVINPNRDF